MVCLSRIIRDNQGRGADILTPDDYPDIEDHVDQRKCCSCGEWYPEEMVRYSYFEKDDYGILRPDPDGELCEDCYRQLHKNGEDVQINPNLFKYESDFIEAVIFEITGDERMSSDIRNALDRVGEIHLFDRSV